MTQRAFTLIELLVVVAVIAILATLGAVNYQAAQARAKVSRVQSDMRTIATALEAYRTDNAAYPHAAIAGGDILLEDPLWRLESPVAYLAEVPRDVFGPAPYNFSDAVRFQGYVYRDRATTSIGMSGDTYGPVWAAVPEGRYMLHSCGPNVVWDVVPYVEYDPTNGAVSIGDITRFGPF
ncbi:MAG: type II secretion system protein [Candidatus Sumerlaeia bacterium]|nr:type II secretion system protein [Candidatus Sumerlaeia bacterium]